MLVFTKVGTGNEYTTLKKFEKKMQLFYFTYQYLFIYYNLSCDGKVVLCLCYICLISSLCYSIYYAHWGFCLDEKTFRLWFIFITCLYKYVQLNLIDSFWLECGYFEVTLVFLAYSFWHLYRPLQGHILHYSTGQLQDWIEEKQSLFLPNRSIRI